MKIKFRIETIFLHVFVTVEIKSLAVSSYRSRKIVTGDSDGQVLPLELDEDDDGFLVAENPQFSVVSDNQRRRHSSFVRDDRDVVLVSRKSVDVVPSMMVPERRRPPCAVAVVPPQTKEKEMVKNLRPLVWLTEQFPLKTEELLPLLDILANKVKAVRRMRDLLTTKFPTGTFPVKVRGILGISTRGCQLLWRLIIY